MFYHETYNEENAFKLIEAVNDIKNIDICCKYDFTKSSL